MEGGDYVLSKLVIFTFVLVGGSIGYNSLPGVFLLIEAVPEWIAHPLVGMVLGAGAGWVLSFPFIKPIKIMFDRIETFISEQNASYLLFGSLGAIIGLILALLISFTLNSIPIPFVSEILPFVIGVILAYAGYQFGSSRREEIRRLFQTRSAKEPEDGVLERKEGDSFRKYKILDTSAIIDGRILEVVKTGFMEGVFVVSHHVLQELQFIADSSDSLKRVRGRRGLDILNALQKEQDIAVQMDDSELPESEEVDMKLVYLAKKMDGVVVTNDFNLNKVAEFQNVPVLNINELANAVKPVVIPGENMNVFVVKNGTERSQGVAYLDDGTMVVVEEGKHYINESIDVVVTSSLQTNAGRMIFAKLAHSQQAIDERTNTNE